MRGMNRTRSSVTAALLCIAAAVSACSDDNPDDTVTPPPTTTSAAPSPSEVPTPTLPAAAKADKAGAEAFVRYFWDVFNYTYASGDTKLLRSISDKNCKFCQSVADDVDLLTSNGDRTEGSRASLRTVIAPPADPREGFLVYTVIAQSGGRIITADGSVRSTSPAEPEQRSDVRVQWIDGAWRMIGVSFGGPKGTP
jgi:hypothetical protein